MGIATLSRRAILRTLTLAAGTAAVSATGAAAWAAPVPAGTTTAGAAVVPATTSRGARATSTVFVVGDSTASAYEHGIRPRTGWGQSLALLVGPKTEVFDYAWSGASSKSFADAGKLDTVLAMMAPGDTLLISFGHNDSKTTDPERGTDPDTTYKAYLRRYIDGARAAGGHPVLVTPVERRRFDAAGAARSTHGEYPRAMRELAAATGTPLVDLTESSRALWQELGPEGTLTHFLHLEPGAHPQFPEGAEDNTHFHAVGALAVARLVATELVAQGIVKGSAFTRIDAEVDPMTETYWPPERPVDAPEFIDVGPGGDFTSVQAAVDAVPANSSQRTIIRIAPGEYREVVRVRSPKQRVTFLGAGAGPADTVLVFDNASGTPLPDGGGTYGTTGSASTRVDAAYFHAENLTFANDFDPAANPQITNTQAVALLLAADLCVLRNVRFLGRQDTLYVNSPQRDEQARYFIDSCYVEGDVDFVFGRGTAVFNECHVASLDRGSATNNGYVTASSIDQQFAHGYLFDRCRFTSEAARGTVHLGRPWHPGGDPEAIAQVLVRDSWLDRHIKVAPWADMSGFSWRDARFAEYANRGPGAATGPDRPQLPAGQASEYTAAAYLRAGDGWAPQLAGSTADSTALLSHA
ncbi:pectin esterase [Kocuria polaris]|nr:pectin esterase [Kocuria polaris]